MRVDVSNRDSLFKFHRDPLNLKKAKIFDGQENISNVNQVLIAYLGLHVHVHVLHVQKDFLRDSLDFTTLTVTYLRKECSCCV